MFKKKIKIDESRSIMRDSYWLLDTLEYSLQNFVEPTAGSFSSNYSS